MAQQSISEVPVTLRLSSKTEAALAQRAIATGKPLPIYIANLIESLLETPRTMEQISGPVYQRFLDSGTTDEQLSEELEKAKHEMRAERRERQAT